MPAHSRTERQSYTIVIVEQQERSAAAGITGVARTTAAAIAPLFAGILFSKPDFINYPFFIPGTLKVGYDLLLFSGRKPAEERG